MPTDNELYHYHVENLRSIETGLGVLSRAFRQAIATNKEQAIYSYTCIYSLILAAWAETRLLKLLFEPAGFPIQKRKLVLAKKTQIERWEKTIDEGFIIHFGSPLTPEKLGFTPFSKYQEIRGILKYDLEPIIETRNKLAHGQWKYLFNSELTSLSQEQMQIINTETLFSLQFKKTILGSISALVNDLIVSPPTFDRDFDANYIRILQTKRNLSTRKYSDYRRSLMLKHENGKVLKQQR